MEQIEVDSSDIAKIFIHFLFFLFCFFFISASSFSHVIYFEISCASFIHC